MARQEPSTRIGEAERTAAQRALHDHLSAGRLQVAEYAERSAAAAGATTASEIAALFTDLPAPHPKLPGSPGGGPRRALAIVGVIAAVVLVGVLAFAIGRGAQPAPVAGPAPTQSQAPRTATSSAPPTSNAAPSTATPTATAGGGDLPGGVQVRRTTDAGTITLRPSYGVDLDDGTSPNWGANQSCCDSDDVRFTSGGTEVDLSADYAIMAGPADYTACSSETAYTSEAIERGTLAPGQNICVRTGDDRFAVVTVVDTSEQAFQFRATVWDPPFAS